MPKRLLGSAMNVAYTKKLAVSIPDEVKKMSEYGTIAGVDDSGVLLAKPSMEKLEKSFQNKGSQGQELFEQTVRAIRNSLETGLRSVFWVGAITMLISFLLIITVPEVDLDAGAEEPKAEAVEEAVR